MKRDSFVFYRSFMEALNDLPPKEYKAVMMVIQQYAFDGVEPNLTGVAKVVFNLVKPQIEANNKRYENGCKGAEYGALGGRPRKENNPTKTPNDTPTKPLNNPTETPSKPQVNPTKTPNDNDNVNDNVNVNDNNNLNNKKEKEINNTRACEVAFHERVLDEVKPKVPEIAYETFFKTLRYRGRHGTTIHYEDNSIISSYVEEHRDKLEEAIMKVSNGEYISFDWV